jgi:FecR protein
MTARAPGLLLALACWLALPDCSSCDDAAFVAELTSKEASVERDYGRAPEQWSAADTGARFELGDGLRTGASAQATLALPRRARLLVKSDTVVRFKHSLDDSLPLSQIEMQQGELTIETGALDLGVNTARGVVRLTQGTSVRMKSEAQKTHFDVVVGRVEYAREGTTRSVEAGGGFDVEVLRASVEPQAPQLTSTTSTTAPQLDAAVAPIGPHKPAANGGKSPPAELEYQDSPATAIVTLFAGESAVIHDPSPPTDVRLPFDQCQEATVLELDRGNGRYDALRVRGAEEVRARVPRGEYRYRLRCVHDGKLQEPLNRGRLTVIADAATRPLPSAPATITADADGRRYTVSYQNRLPIVTLRWPDAPRAASYRLFVRPESGAQFSLSSNRSSVTLEPGRVAEGLHEFWFATADDARRSEKGLLQVSFDYAARTAYLTSPIEGDAAHDARTRFAGGTLLGSTVQAQGAPLKLDAQGRFDAEVAVPAGAGGAYVRVAHRSTGIHYYIRHLR